MKLLNYLFSDVGIDLGTTNSLVYLSHRGLMLDEPSVAAINTKTNQIIAVGDEARKMMGRTPAHINVVRPLVGGVVSDFEMTQEMLRQFLRRSGRSSIGGFRRGVLAIPNGVTEVERKSVEDAAKDAGCAKVYLVEAPVAAALGARLPILSPTASLIVDIGGGTTDIAVISMGGIVVAKTLRIAGDKLNEDIIRFVREEFRLAIGEPTAEYLKIAAGSAVPVEGRIEVAIRGRDYTSGLPREVVVKNTHVRQATLKSLRSIVDAIHEVVELTPPELAGDMLAQGIYLCGGGALLRGIEELVERETAVKTSVAEEPLTCVVRGLGQIVDDFKGYRILLDNPLKPLEIKL
ncbi:MAG: rod shape-determining protein [Patescibacteria group bacterium]|nr:rod shape-determining protein [Patescibacteria group bacterium]